MKGLVFDIQHFSIYDGPGIRTTVFLKGCSLDCDWCHNPESISAKKEIQTYFFKCIGCGKCFEICPQGAHKITDNGRHYEREVCKNCGTCADNCYSGALVVTGGEMSVDEVVDQVSKDMPFYENSKGGVTLSGGEPLLQSEFVYSVLVELNKKKIHTAVDTAGNVPFSSFRKVIPYTDLFLYDIKAVNPDLHRDITGVGNELILDNLQKLCKENVTIIVRIPVIPGVNAKEMESIAELLSGLENIEAVEPLPYHSLGAGKMESLGKAGSEKTFTTPDKNMMMDIYRIFESAGLKVIKKPG